MDNQAFKALKAKWDAKLKKSGFDDIEVEGTDLLRGGNPIRTDNGKRNGGPWELKAEYYRLAHHFLNEKEFANRIDEIIWEYHSEGMSVRDIVLTLNKVRRKKVNRMLIWRIVERLRDEMKALYGVR